jgi:hypothetical protein
MAGKRATKKRTSRKTKSKSHVMTIPQLRKAFEHIETFVELHCKTPKPALVKQFKQEWKLTFKKEIDTKEAEAYVDHALEELKRKKPSQRKHSGGAMALTGAPILTDTRPGLYISPGVNEGSYAQVPAYIDKGFWNPEIGRQYDPVPGQTHYPAYTPYGMGSNRVSGGTRKKRGGKKQQSGGGVLDTISDAIGQFSASRAVNQLMMRPGLYVSEVPSAQDNLATARLANSMPQSPDPSQTRTNYQSNLTGIEPPFASSSITRLPTITNPLQAWFQKSDYSTN